MTALTELEPYVDKCVELFLTRIAEVTDSGAKSIDISVWLQYFAFDVLGEINFSRQLGFLKTGTDVDNNIAAIDAILQYASLVSSQVLWKSFLAFTDDRPCRLANCRYSTISCWGIRFCPSWCQDSKKPTRCCR